MLYFKVNRCFGYNTIRYCRNQNLLCHKSADRHFQIQPAIGGSHPGIYRSPVRHQNPFKSPLLTQHINVKPSVLGGMYSVERIITIHHRSYPGFLYRFTKSWEINFLQSTFVYVRACMMPAPFLVISGKMFHRSHHSLFLNAQYIFFSNFTRQIRVFTEILVITSAQGRTVDIDTRT